MAKTTTTYTLGEAWTQIAGAGQTVYMQALLGAGQIYYAYKTSAPAAGSSGHVLDPGESFIESTLPAPLWARSNSTGRLAASVGGSTTAGATRNTSTFALTGAWTLVASAGQAVHLDHISGATIRWVYASAAPASLLGGHALQLGEEYIDAATDQNIYARAMTDDINSAYSTLVVTAG